MFSKTDSVIINSSISNVWRAIVDPKIFYKWAFGVMVESDWEVDSDIKYSYIDSDGNTKLRNNCPMVWFGKIKKIQEQKLFCVEFYDDISGYGLLKQEYKLNKISHDETKLELKQTFLSSKNCKDHEKSKNAALENIKNFWENETKKYTGLVYK